MSENRYLLPFCSLPRRDSSQLYQHSRTHYEASTQDRDERSEGPDWVDLEKGRMETTKNFQDDSDSGLLSPFGFNPRHPLRKAFLTTFKAFSDSIKSRAQALYASGFREAASRAERDPESLTPVDHPRLLHRISHSLSRHFKDNGFRGPGSQNTMAVPGQHPFPADPADVLADNKENKPSIEMAFPQPVFSSLHLEYPWLEPPGQSLRRVDDLRGNNRVVGALGRSYNAVSPLANHTNVKVPLRVSSRLASLQRKDGTSQGRPNIVQGSTTKQAPVERTGVGQTMKSADQGAVSNSYDADIESGESEPSRLSYTPSMGSREVWLKKREERQKRYEVIALMSPTRSLPESDSIVSATSLDNDDDPFLEDGFAEHSLEGQKCPPMARSSTKILNRDATVQLRTTSSDSVIKFTLKRPCRMRQKPLYSPIDAIKTHSVFDLYKAAVDSSTSPRGFVKETASSKTDLPSIDTTMKNNDPGMGMREFNACSARPSFNRQLSVLSAESADECAVTSKSQLRIHDIEGSAEHHRQGSVDHSQESKEAVRQKLDLLSEDEKDFLVDAPTTLSSGSGETNPHNTQLSERPASNKGLPIRPKAPCSWPLPGEQPSTVQDEPSSTLRSAFSTPTSSPGSTPSPSPRNRSHVSFLLPEDHAHSPRPSKTYRKPSPCPKLVPTAASKIPVPTFGSSSAAKRKIASLISLQSTLTDGSEVPTSSTADSTNRTILGGKSTDSESTEAAVKYGSAPARLPSYSYPASFCSFGSERRYGGNSEDTAYVTATDGEGGSATDVGGRGSQDVFQPNATFAETFPVSAQEARGALSAESRFDVGIPTNNLQNVSSNRLRPNTNPSAPGSTAGEEQQHQCGRKHHVPARIPEPADSDARQSETRFASEPSSQKAMPWSLLVSLPASAESSFSSMEDETAIAFPAADPSEETSPIPKNSSTTAEQGKEGGTSSVDTPPKSEQRPRSRRRSSSASDTSSSSLPGKHAPQHAASLYDNGNGGGGSGSGYGSGSGSGASSSSSATLVPPQRSTRSRSRVFYASSPRTRWNPIRARRSLGF